MLAVDEARSAGDRSACAGSPKIGRPRDPNADRAILQAVIDLVAEEGIGALTIEAVAARAGVGKTTIYRRWTGKEAMLVDAWRGVVQPGVVPDTGSVVADVRALLRQTSTQDTSMLSRVFPQLLASARTTPELEATLDEFLARRRRAMHDAIVKGIERGELDPSSDPTMLQEMLVGPMLYRIVFRNKRYGHDEIDRLIDAVLRQHLTSGARGSR